MKRCVAILVVLLMLVNAFQAVAEEAAPDWQDDGVLRILGIGNSFTEDTFQFIYTVAGKLGIEQVETAYCWLGGSTVENHVSNIQTGNKAYDLVVNHAGSMRTTRNATIQDAVTRSDWDFIILQQQSSAAGQKSGLLLVSTLAEQVKALCPGAKIAWNMTWPYPDTWTAKVGYEQEFASLYKSDSMVMYNSIVQATQEMVVPCVDVVIPIGTAIVNARQSSMGDKPTTLYRDGLHLSYLEGRYIAAMTAVAALTGMDMTQLEEHIAANIMKKGDFAHRAVEAVNNAIASPWSVTAPQK